MERGNLPFLLFSLFSYLALDRVRKVNKKREGMVYGEGGGRKKSKRGMSDFNR